MIYFIIIAIILLIAMFLYFQNNIIDVTRYVIKSTAVKSRLKIVQLSDLHSKPFKKALKKTEELKPDIIVITGDYITDKLKNKEKMLEYGKELCQIAPVYYITGNHERRLENFNEVMDELSSIGFNVLLNEIKQVYIQDNTLAILGLDEKMGDFDDYKERKRGNYEYENMKPYFTKLSLYEGFKLVLSHFPESFEGIEELNYSKYDFDLMLSGHAHGGQFILPIIGPVYSPGQGFHPKYARGSFGDRPKLIISRGLGNSEFPFRLFNHPEINIITVSRRLK